MTCQGISLGLVSIGCCCFSFLSLEGGFFYLFFTRIVSEVTVFLCPEFANLRIFSSHGLSRRSRIFFVPNFRISEFFSSHGLSRNNLFYHELSNYRMSFTRNVAEVTDFFPRLVLGPTDRREVICELFLHTECRGWLWGLLFMRMGAIRRCL